MEKTKAKTKPKAASTSKKSEKQLTISLPKLNLKSGPMALLVVLTVVFFFVGTRFNGLITVAKVGKKPIMVWDLIGSTWQRYRASALVDLVREELILQTAAQMGLEVSPEEIQEQADLMADDYGGEASLREELKKSGISYEDQLENIRIGLLVNKIIMAQVEVKETEIDALIRDYGDNLAATDSAGKREEAREIVESQKAYEVYETIFEDLVTEIGVDYYVSFGH